MLTRRAFWSVSQGHAVGAFMGRNPPPLGVQNAKEVSSTRARSWWVVQIVWGGCVRLDGASIHARAESVRGSTPMECTAASPQTADALPIV